MWTRTCSGRKVHTPQQTAACAHNGQAGRVTEAGGSSQVQEDKEMRLDRQTLTNMNLCQSGRDSVVDGSGRHQRASTLGA